MRAKLRTLAIGPWNNWSDLVGELSTHSEEFGVRWAAHNVRFHRSGDKSFDHPVVGDITVTYEVMELPADPGQVLIALTAEPNSSSQDALNLLANWAATPDEVSAGPVEEDA